MSAQSPSDAPHAPQWSHADIVYHRLRWDQANAQTIGQLADLTLLTRRQVEQALEELVSGGSHPIVAGPWGVYLTADPAELDAYADALLRRARSQYRRVRGVRRCARAMRQPRTLWDAAA